ncbi:MAG: hypothetical protein ABW003_05175 [Microvirga sp.]
MTKKTGLQVRVAERDRAAAAVVRLAVTEESLVYYVWHPELREPIAVDPSTLQLLALMSSGRFPKWSAVRPRQFFGTDLPHILARDSGLVATCFRKANFDKWFKTMAAIEFKAVKTLLNEPGPGRPSTYKSLSPKVRTIVDGGGWDGSLPIKSLIAALQNAGVNRRQTRRLSASLLIVSRSRRTIHAFAGNFENLASR